MISSGYVTKPISDKNEKVTVLERIDSIDLNVISEHEIKRILAKSIGFKLLEDNKLKFQRKDGGLFNAFEFSAEVWVQSRKFTSMVIEDRAFKVNGVDFFEDEIEKALINTYPERLV